MYKLYLETEEHKETKTKQLQADRPAAPIRTSSTASADSSDTYFSIYCPSVDSRCDSIVSNVTMDIPGLDSPSASKMIQHSKIPSRLSRASKSSKASSKSSSKSLHANEISSYPSRQISHVTMESFLGRYWDERDKTLKEEDRTEDARNRSEHVRVESFASTAFEEASVDDNSEQMVRSLASSAFEEESVDDKSEQIMVRSCDSSSFEEESVDHSEAPKRSSEASLAPSVVCSQTPNQTEGTGLEESLRSLSTTTTVDPDKEDHTRASQELINSWKFRQSGPSKGSFGLIQTPPRATIE